jgi:hypothetical protein
MLSFRPHEIHFRAVMKQVFDVPHKIYSGTGQQNKKKSNETFAVRNKSDVIMEGPQQQRRFIHLSNVFGVILRREFHAPPARSVLWTQKISRLSRTARPIQGPLTNSDEVNEFKKRNIMLTTPFPATVNEK